MNDTSSMAGQSPCVGCGSELIWWLRVSLLTNETREPGAIVTFLGDTPLAVMAIVAAIGPPLPPPDGEVGPSSPPQDVSSSDAQASVQAIMADRHRPTWRRRIIGRTS